MLNDEQRKILSSQEPGHVLAGALDELLRRDGYLLVNDVNERSITHKLAMYMQEIFPAWDIDCEYNRDGHLPKEMYLADGGDPSQDDEYAQTVFPDIIAHIRGTNKNYLVIEVKKTSSRISARKDFAKLEEYKGQLGYRFALFVELAVNKKTPSISRIEWV